MICTDKSLNLLYVLVKGADNVVKCAKIALKFSSNVLEPYRVIKTTPEWQRSFFCSVRKKIWFNQLIGNHAGSIPKAWNTKGRGPNKPKKPVVRKEAMTEEEIHAATGTLVAKSDLVAWSVDEAGQRAGTRF